jgi:hypothetical protein
MLDTIDWRVAQVNTPARVLPEIIAFTYVYNQEIDYFEDASRRIILVNMKLNSEG